MKAWFDKLGSLQDCKFALRSKGVAREEGGNSPPRNRRNGVENAVISEGSLVTHFGK